MRQHRGAVIRETLKVVEYAALFVAAFLCYALDAQDAPLIGAVAIAAIVVSLSALAQEIVGAPSGLYIGPAIVPRIAGLLEGPNQLAGYCEIAVATLGAWALVRRSRLLDVALGADGLHRRAYVLASGMDRACGRCRAARRRRRQAHVARDAAGVWWAWSRELPVPHGGRSTPTRPACCARRSSRASTPAASETAASSGARPGACGSARPILGVGAGNFELALPAYGVFGVRTHANSWYLQSLAEGGILALRCDARVARRDDRRPYWGATAAPIARRIAVGGRRAGARPLRWRCIKSSTISSSIRKSAARGGCSSVSPPPRSLAR